MTSSEIHAAALDAGIKASWFLQNQNMETSNEPYVVTNVLDVAGSSDFEWEVSPCWIKEGGDGRALAAAPGYVEGWEWRSWDLSYDEFNLAFDEYKGVGIVFYPFDESVNFMTKGPHDRRPDVPEGMAKFLSWLDDQDVAASLNE